MRTTVKTVIAAALIAGAPAVFAATHVGNHQDRPAGNMNGMGHGMGMKNNDMPMMMTQMNDMMEHCNKMMQSKMENSKNAGDGSEKS